MAPKTFHLFTSLPFELRSMIYLLATPPRFVHIQEAHEDEEEFEEKFRTEPVQLRLHPSLAYFARNWRERIRGASDQRQMTLEMFGLACPRQRHQPWESTSEVPDIPHHFVGDNPNVAWEFVRKGSFYSAAPIPALLHVSAESRQALMGAGYELAFRTRTSGPRTWFNFKTDILYLKHFTDGSYERTNSNIQLLSGNYCWDIGQFEPQELMRVKKLALEGAGRALSSRFQQSYVPQISSILHLFKNLEELFLEESGMNDNRSFARARCPEDIEGLWCYMPPLEVDVVPSAGPYELNRDEIDYMLECTGPYHYDLKLYKDENMGDGSGYFVHAAHEFEKKLASKRDELVVRERLTPWKIPTISVVYITYPSVCRKLYDWRWDMWYRFQDLTEKEARLHAFEEARRSIDVPRRPIFEDDGLALSPFSAQFEYEEEAYEEMFESEASSHGYFDEYMYSGRHRWLLSAGAIPPPKS
ncbi:hypothetical protein GGR51DRAFT_515573 [Nemania sp. FL0031]|nr:hypothetical protein GGR51DRAFT_515573 [Nemania sp. FL0031]